MFIFIENQVLPPHKKLLNDFICEELNR